MTPRCEPARPFFLRVGSRDIFCLHHAPAGAPRGAVVYVPPFVEEMNKSRRMAALQSRSLAVAGWHVLQPDLCGTGDSEGDFADASWAAWLDDLAAARGWLAQTSGFEPWLWGLRLGALLAGASLAQQPAPGIGLVLWQPVLSGRQHLQQFLRLKAGSEWLASGRESEAAAKPMQQLQAGQAVEVAGYTLSPSLALPMAQAELQLGAAPARLAWFEVSPREGSRLSPASERVLAGVPAACRTRLALIQGPSFWQAQEIETAPALLAATCEAFAA